MSDSSQSSPELSPELKVSIDMTPLLGATTTPVASEVGELCRQNEASLFSLLCVPGGTPYYDRHPLTCGPVACQSTSFSEVERAYIRDMLQPSITIRERTLEKSLNALE